MPTTPVESAVAITGAGAAQSVRNLAVTTRNADGTLTTKIQQVVSVADSDGSLLDVSVVSVLKDIFLILRDIRREILIQNEILVNGLNLKVDLDKEYRRDEDGATNRDKGITRNLSI